MSSAARPAYAQPLLSLPGSMVERERMDRQSKLALQIGIGLSLLWLTSFVVGFKTILAVLSAAGFLLAVIGLRMPMLGVVGIGIICSLDALMRVYLMKGGLLRYNTFNYWLLFVLFLSLPIQLKLKDPQTRILQAFTLLLTVEILVSPSYYHAVLHMLNLVTFFGLIVYFYRARKYQQVWYVLGVTTGLLSALTGFAFFYNNDGLSFSTVDELAFLDPDFRDPNYIDANALGYVFLTGAFSLCLALSWLRHSNRRMVMPLLVLLGINFCWITLVGSRGSMLVGSGCVIYTLVSLRSGSRRFKFLLVAALGALFVVNMFPNFLERSFGRVQKLMDNSYTAAQRTSARSDLAIGSLYLFAKHPLGVGTGGFKKSWSKLDVKDLTSNQVGKEKAAHTAWGKTLAENGVPGFILFSMYVFSFAYYGFKQRRRGALPIGVLATVMLSCAFVATEFQSKGIWFITGATIVYLQYRRRHPGEPSPRTVRQLRPLIPDSPSSAAVIR